MDGVYNANIFIFNYFCQLPSSVGGESEPPEKKKQKKTPDTLLFRCNMIVLPL